MAQRLHFILTKPTPSQSVRENRGLTEAGGAVYMPQRFNSHGAVLLNHTAVRHHGAEGMNEVLCESSFFYFF